MPHQATVNNTVNLIFANVELNETSSNLDFKNVFFVLLGHRICQCTVSQVSTITAEAITTIKTRKKNSINHRVLYSLLIVIVVIIYLLILYAISPIEKSAIISKLHSY